MIRCSLRPPRFAFQAFWANDLYFACIVLILPAQRLTWLVKLELGFCLVSMYAHLKLTCLVSSIDRLWAIVNIFWGLRQPSIEMAKLLNLIYLSISPSKPQSSVPKVIVFHLFHLMISILNSMIVCWDHEPDCENPRSEWVLRYFDDDQGSPQPYLVFISHELQLQSN